MVLTLPHKPAGDQWNYFNLPTRHTVGLIGRQWGKSTNAQLRAVRDDVTKKEKANRYWVSPIVPQARVQFERFCKEYSAFVKKVNRTHMEAQYLTNGWIHFKGSDNPASMKGDTLTGATMDECATQHETVWSESLRPMLAVNKGGCDFIGTPKGKNWFYLLWQQAATDPEFSRHHASSEKSPYFSRTEFESIRQSTPEAIFRQEYLAEFIDAGSEVFRDFRQCIKGELEEPKAGRLYVMGADIAKHVDWTVITIWDVERRHLVYFDRFNQIDWPLIESRISAACVKYNRARIRLDATGVGDPVFDRLNSMALPVYPVRINSAVKTHLIESLIMAVEKREITFPHIPDMLQEFSIFSAKKSPSGHIQYSAPPGYHDDIVLSSALAVSELVSMTPKPMFISAN